MRTHLSFLAFVTVLVSACADRGTVTAPALPEAVTDVSLSRDGDHDEHESSTGGIFAETNSATGNAVVAYARGVDGSLSPLGSYSTGGNGTGGTVDPLASQYALVLSPSRRYLFAVNAGSNTIATFEVKKHELKLVGTVSSGGARPVSLAATEHVLYALNAGNNVLAGFRIGGDGRLRTVPQWTRQLSAGAQGAAVVRFSRDGRVLAVAERASNTIDSYVVNQDGALGRMTTTASSGRTPFGFDFGNGRLLVISEAASNAASSYRARYGSLSLVSASVLAGPTAAVQRAPCWLIVSRNGRYAYTANAGSGTITGYAISGEGALSLVTSSGITGDVGAGSTPLDLDVSDDGRFLYQLAAGTGEIVSFAIHRDGSLTRLSAVAAFAPRSGQMGIAAF